MQCISSDIQVCKFTISLKWTLSNVSLEIFRFKDFYFLGSILLVRGQKGKYQNVHVMSMSKISCTCSYHLVRDVFRKFCDALLPLNHGFDILFYQSFKACLKTIANLKGTATQLIKQQLNYCINANT